jgi:2,5-diamino-6-(ribosylamino)-4(3H)-pyrimidinone 5'-phosphate reductase
MRPFVYVNMAMTADGKITSALREYPELTSRHDRANMDRLRADADAILVGAGTLRADDPPLHVRSEALRALRRTLGKPDGLDRVVVSARLDLAPDSRFFDDAHGGKRIVATVEDAPSDRVAALGRLAEVWRHGRGAVDLRAVLRRLRECGVERLLVEGGGETNWALVRDDLVDELHVTVAPWLLGGRDAPTMLEGPGFPMADRRALRLADVRRIDDELYLRYAVVRP